MAARKARRWISFPVQVLRGARAYLLPWRGYRSQDKYNFSFVAGPLVERARSLSSRITACVPRSADDIVAQTRRSIAWVYRHARIMGGDPNAITISGHSAGAHIVARALEACWDDHGAPDDVIKAAISLSGIYDRRRGGFLSSINICGWIRPSP